MVELVVVFAREGEMPVQNHVEQDPQGPAICHLAIILLLCDDLGTHVSGRAAENGQKLPLLGFDTESEVDDFYVPPIYQQKVFELDVSVADIALVQIRNRLSDLLK